MSIPAHTRRQSRSTALVVGASTCLALTIGCARGAPDTIEQGKATGTASEEAVASGSQTATATPGTHDGYPPSATRERRPDGESDAAAWPAADAYPGGRRQAQPPPVAASQRTATRVAAEATMSAARASAADVIAAVLPAGATFDLDELDDWSGALGAGGQGLPIRLRDGGLDYVAFVAARLGEIARGAVEPYARLVWRMTETVPVAEVTAIRETGLDWPEHDARGLQVETGASTALVVVAFATGGRQPEVRDAFALTGVLAASRASEWPDHSLMAWESDAPGLLVGSTVAGRDDGAVRRRLTVHGAPSGGIRPLVATFGPDASVLDVDGDGSLEIVAAAGDERHEAWRLTGDGLAADGDLPSDAAPAIVAVGDGSLPALPADLYLYRLAAGGEVWRWQATGARLERVGPKPGARVGSGPVLRMAAPRADEAMAWGRPPYQVARDAPVVVYALAQEDDAAHAVALGFQDLSTDSWHEVPITGTLGSWSVAPDGRSALYLGRGALSGVSWSYAADDAGLFLVTPGAIEETRLIARCEPVSPGEPYGTLGCASFAPDATWSYVAYGDGHGVWSMPLAGGSPRRVLEHQLAETDDEIFETRVYRPVRWSPDGIWLSLEAGRYEGSTGALLNLQTGGVFDLDGTGQGIESGSSLAFSPDSSQVGIARHGYFRELAAVSLFDLASRTSREFLSGSPVTGRYNGIAAAFTAEGRFRFGTWSPWQDRYRADGVFELDPASGAVRRLARGLASLDPRLVAGSPPPDLVWSPNAEAFALAGATSYDGWYVGALIGTAAATYDASEILAGAGFLQWSRAGQ